MRIILAIAVAGMLFGPARADDTLYRCDGVLTSNNVCIGSESTVDTTQNHEPVAGTTYFTKRNPGLTGQRQRDRDDDTSDDDQTTGAPK